MKYSDSLAEPNAIFRYRAKSCEVNLPQPSAIFAGIEEAALHN